MLTWSAFKVNPVSKSLMNYYLYKINKVTFQQRLLTVNDTILPLLSKNSSKNNIKKKIPPRHYFCLFNFLFI